MRLVTFGARERTGVGVRRDGTILDTGYETMLDLILDGEAGLERAAAATEEVEGARIVAPIPAPGKILCSGINYASHKEENPDAVMPTEPFFFSKLPSAVIGPGEEIIVPTPETQTDYEVELAMVIGRAAKDVSEATALEYVFGWTLLNDVSARNIQFKDNQLTLGKGVDTFSPLGPEIVTADELGDWSTLHISSRLNGEEMQSSATSEMLFPPARLLEFLTALVTLYPGDVVSTGSPAGVGVFRDPPVYLQPGDEITIAADRIGELTNPVASGW
jgi:2-keto-4-pentenoate hydratase/2-oxohepta-3-ene-1,7-dioic acid hydratase in catechol pathway